MSLDSEKFGERFFVREGERETGGLGALPGTKSLDKPEYFSAE